MTTDVAETTEQVTDPASSTTVTEPTGAESTATGVLPGKDTEATNAQGTEGVGDELGLGDVFKSVLGDLPAPAAEEVKLPGKPLAEIEASLKEQRAKAYETILENGEQVSAQRLINLGFSQADADSIWEAVGKPLLNSLHANHDDYSNKLENESVALALAEDELALWNGRAVGDRIEKNKLLVAIGRDLERKAWEEKVAKDYIPMAKLTTIKEAVEVKYRAALEAAGLIRGARSGDAVEGVTPGGTADLTPEEAASLPLHDPRVQKFRAQRGL